MRGGGKVEGGKVEREWGSPVIESTIKIKIKIKTAYETRVRQILFLFYLLYLTSISMNFC